MDRRSSGFAALASLGVCAIVPAVALAQHASFEGLGVPGETTEPTVFSWANGVSADGRVIVGEMGPWPNREGRQAFRWTEAEGLVGLGDLPDGNFESIAFGASADGSTVIGRGSSRHVIGNLSFEAFEWDAQAGMTGIGGYVPTEIDTTGLGPNFLAVGRSVSDDASVIVGAAVEIIGRRGDFVMGGLRPAGWGPDRSITGLGVIDDDSAVGQANGVSADGTVIVGSETYGRETGERRAFVWTETTGMRSLGALGAFVIDSAATAVSADGTTVVGRANSPGGTVAFRWTEQTGMRSLGALPGMLFGEASAVSGDGGVIVGFAQVEDGIVATVWTPADGLRRLGDVLRDGGVELGGWQLGDATGVSRDGRVVVGFGVNPGGQIEAFRTELFGACTADVNDDGRVNFFDIVVYIHLVLAQDPRADLNDDSMVDFADVLEFIHAFFEGC